MTADVLEGGFQNAPIEAATVFRAALDALARPGKVHQVAGVLPPAPLGIAAGALALTLCDFDTGVWLAPSVATDNVLGWLAFHTGARQVDREHADFVFGGWAEMLPLTDFRIGTPDYPDRSATLIVEVPVLDGGHRLTGPGIRNHARLPVPDPAAFRANSQCFPLGWDAILTCGDRMAGLPRTTKVEG
ncbi:MAG: phosphonate C-P lyase system protein PhnH [Pseudomonadota bacterium]